MEYKLKSSWQKKIKKRKKLKKPLQKKKTSDITKKKTAKKVVKKKIDKKPTETDITTDKENLKPSKKTSQVDLKEKKVTKQNFSSDDFLKNFDWENYEEGIETIEDKKLKEFEKIVSENFVDTKGADVVVGKVIHMTDKEAIIDINAKSEGVISLNEFRYNPDLKVGDSVDVMIDVREDKTGQLILSHRKARTLMAWDKVNAAHKSQEIVTGFVKCRTKGGMIVDVFGIEAFLPGSQIDVKPIRDYDQYVNKKMEFKIVKINHEFKNVVVSHKALIEADIEEQKKEIISQLEKGQVLEGVVKNITSYGVFIDLGGIDGLVHITDLSWNRINHPSEILEVEQSLNVVILDFDDDKSRIQLGVKQLSKHPWDAIGDSINEGDKLKGKVSVIADYGAFVEVAEGVEGLVHVSEMSWSTHLRSAQDFVKVGDEVEVVVLTLDKEDRKMSLGIKQLTQDPWTDITIKYPLGSKHSGIVRNYTNFGVFVELEEGIDGLIYISDLSWTKKVKHPSEIVTVGQKLDVIVLELDVDGRKLSLGHKQTTDNPWEKYSETYSEGSIHELSITDIVDKGATIKLNEDINAFVPRRHMEKQDGQKLSKGEKAEFKVIEFSKDFKRIVMSHSAVFKGIEADNIKKNNLKNKESVEKSTLGDIDALADLKSKMDKG
jgi:small subunit ribosomal protein S1